MARPATQRKNKAGNTKNAPAKASPTKSTAAVTKQGNKKRQADASETRAQQQQQAKRQKKVEESEEESEEESDSDDDDESPKNRFSRMESIANGDDAEDNDSSDEEEEEEEQVDDEDEEMEEDEEEDEEEEDEDEDEDMITTFQCGICPDKVLKTPEAVDVHLNSKVSSIGLDDMRTLKLIQVTLVSQTS